MKENGVERKVLEPDTHCYSKHFKKYELVMLDLHLEEGHKHPVTGINRGTILCVESWKAAERCPVAGCRPFLLPNLLRTNNLW